MKQSKIRTIITIAISMCVAIAMLSVNASAASTTWYSQQKSSVGTKWSSEKLNYLYFPNMESCSNNCGGVGKCSKTPFYAESLSGSEQLNKGHINKWGCNICSLAMIFSNMGATTTETKTDFRNNTSGKLKADPFTVTMANLEWPTITKVNSTRYEIGDYTSANSPVYIISWSTTSSSFGKKAYKVDLSNKTSKEKADALAYYINKNPEGILVRVNNSHSVVFTKTTHPVPTSLSLSPILITSSNEKQVAEKEWLDSQYAVTPLAVSSTSYDSKFTCYDPGTQHSSKGNGVTYDLSWCAGYYGGIDKVNYLYYFD